MKKDELGKLGMHAGAAPSVYRNAQILRQNMTEPELKLWEYLKTKPLGFKFRRQHPISVYVLDFYCHKLRLSIEIDGGYHLQKEQREKDLERTNYLKELGISEMRFTNSQILNEYNAVIKNINTYLSEDIPLGTEGFPLQGVRGQRKGKNTNP